MVLVTGGSGLVGSELITQLIANGKIVRAIYNKTPLPPFEHGAVTQMQCNILDVVALEEAMQGITELYHCAAMVSFNPVYRKQMFTVNVEGTANVVNAALDAGVKKMVYISSVAALSKHIDTDLIDETKSWNAATNHSNYGQSKHLAELEVWRGIAEGLNAAIVNPAIILGAGNWNEGSTKIFKNVYDQSPWYAEGSTGFVDVKDVVKALMALMQSDITAQRFIVSATNTTYKNLFELIAKGFNKKPPHKKVTPLIAAIVWRLAAVQSFFTKEEPLITKETAASALTNINYNNSKLKTFLPNFEYQSLERTIEDICISLMKKM